MSHVAYPTLDVMMLEQDESEREETSRNRATGNTAHLLPGRQGTARSNCARMRIRPGVL